MRNLAFIIVLAACTTQKSPKDPVDVTVTVTTPPTTDTTPTTGDTGEVVVETAQTGDTGPVCDDLAERVVGICWQPGPELVSSQDGVLMLAAPYGAWGYTQMVYGPFTELCAPRVVMTGSIVKVQAVYTNLNPAEVPQNYAGTWWAIANWGAGVEAKGVWKVDGVAVSVNIVGYDGEIVIPSCE